MFLEKRTKQLSMMCVALDAMINGRRKQVTTKQSFNLSCRFLYKEWPQLLSDFCVSLLLWMTDPPLVLFC